MQKNLVFNQSLFLGQAKQLHPDRVFLKQKAHTLTIANCFAPALVVGVRSHGNGTQFDNSAMGDNQGLFSIGNALNNCPPQIGLGAGESGAFALQIGRASCRERV